MALQPRFPAMYLWVQEERLRLGSQSLSGSKNIEKIGISGFSRIFRFSRRVLGVGGFKNDPEPYYGSVLVNMTPYRAIWHMNPFQIKFCDFHQKMSGPVLGPGPGPGLGSGADF